MSTLRVNDRVIAIRPRETVLQAALRADVPFPNSCRVGGCGACKCRLASGEVRELTETGYLLSREELEQGVILACQSVPAGDVAIEVELATAVRAGTVLSQHRVTHDITRLTVQLDEPLPYKAGQFANLSLSSITSPHGAPLTRSYSFATPASADGRVHFLVREVPGGRVSSAIHQRDLTGERVRVDGPHGDLWLRPGTGPLLLVAGGSGLAPLLALLQAAVATGDTRPVTLLFGARTRADLYALEELDAIARAWAAPFVFVPVLSSACDDPAWTGARGLVTDHLPAELPVATDAYLCGPPAMIDGAVAALEARGLAREHVHVDRFVTAHPAPSEPASAWHYLKYFLFHVVGLTAAAAIFAGGGYITAALVAILAFYILGDAVAGDDTSTPRFTRPGILTVQLWLALPLLGLVVTAAVSSVHADHTAAHHVATVILTGLMIGMIGTITAHELTHRTWDPISMRIGRWLLAFSFDTAFSIEHVYGHHRYVATTEDPATAPRGRNVYHHVIASTIKGNVSAWRIEADRLAKLRRARWSRHNAVLRGYAMSLVLVAAAFALGGVFGAAILVLSGLWAKALLEIVNYMEHYGIVRDPATPVQPRHSWNTNRRISSWSMFNLTRHSHHHAQGEVPYQDLRPYPEAPMMISGYLTTLLVAMIPPLWHRLMTPKVRAWDRDFASEDERRIAAAANARSGRTDLEARARASFA